jgi:hypothetical protein
VLLVGAVIAGAAVGFATTAAADPEDPAPPPLPPGAGLLTGPVGPDMIVGSPPPASPGVTALGPLGALAGGGAQGYLLGQNPVPSVDGAGALPATQTPGLLDSGSFLMPQNYRVPAPDQDSPYALTEGTPPGPFARVDGWKGAHALAHGAIGRMPVDELGQPLPGTAPPPGTNIPVGPVDELPDPGAPPPPFLPPLPPLG